MAPRPERTPRCAAPTLKVGSHNVRSLTAAHKAAAAAALWTQQKLDIVLLQETKLTVTTVAAISGGLAGWRRAYWCHFGGSGDGGPRSRPARGVAILVRDGCALAVDEGSVTRLSSGADAGNLIHLRGAWGGHRLHIACIYLPNEASRQTQFIEQHLKPLRASLPAGTHALWGGDFNFVPDVALDRVSSVATGSAASHPNTGVQRAWERHLPDLQDAYRVRHPTARTYTHFSPTSAARLDRFVVCGALLPYVAFASLHAPGRRLRAAPSHVSSDHRLIDVTVLRRPGTTDALPAAAPQRPAPAIRRVRLGFAEDPHFLGQLRLFAAARAGLAPAGAAALLAWWPTFKRELARRCFRLASQAREQHRAATAGAAASLEALYARVEAGDTAALADILAARQACARAAAAGEAEHPSNQRRQWLHRQERPAPYITRRLQPPRAANEVPALRRPGGGLATTPQACARLTARYWAGVSAQPATDAAAQEEVLAALDGSPGIAHPLVAALGDTTVTEAELAKALRHTTRGTAPGADGLPSELYCKLPELLPVVARVLTAAGELGRLPPGLHEGVITLIFKAGDKLDPANYRPITLLNTDYRLLAKVLANRLKPLLSSVISREQTAFVPGRSIGENVMLLQLLPHLLRQHGRCGYAVFCDFRKAYDTVDRGFLLRIMERLGVGPGFLAWARLLLRDTRSKALVNGHLSGPAAFEAGVRQGCPLAPLLYLFIGQALLCFLKARGVGIDVAGLRLTGAQYADDMEAFLGSLEELPAFKAAMDTFARATGQGLNPAKTVILPMGLLPPGAAAAGPSGAADFPLRDSAKALGITFCSGTQPPLADWPAMVAKLKDRLTRLAGLKLTAFGRGFGSAAYGVSTFLYLAEFSDLPPAATLAEITRLVARLVSQGQPPNGPSGFSGIRADLVAGNPKEGGFGALPWEPHIRARHAAWFRLLCCDRSAPWATVARRIMLAVAGHDHPLTMVAWACGTQPAAAAAPPPPPGAPAGPGAPPPPPPTLHPVTPGDWCRDAPLDGNPYLRLGDGATCLDALFGELAGSRIQTVGDALAAAADVECTAREYASTVRGALFGGLGLAASAYLDHEHAKQRLGQLAGLIPGAWQLAAQHVSGAPAADSAAGVLLAGVAWTPAAGGDAVPLPGLTVKVGTALQVELLPCTAERRARLAAYAALAGDHRPAAVAAKAAAALLGRLWRSPCRNKHKEVMWRLALRALPLASRMPGSDLGGCGCGHAHPAPDRRHHFWDCPIATGVLDTIAAQLSPPQLPLTPANIWLGRAPPGLHAGVWDVVCLLAVAAMDKGRRLATQRLLGSSGTAAAQQQQQQRRRTSSSGSGSGSGSNSSSGSASIAGSALAAAASRRASAWLWDQLEELCSLGLLPTAWQAAVDPSHPFIIWRAADQRWSARCPR